MNLRRLVAEAGFEYASLTDAVKEGTLASELEAVGAEKEDVEEIERLVREHFDLAAVENEDKKEKCAIATTVSNGGGVTANQAVNGT